MSVREQKEVFILNCKQKRNLKQKGQIMVSFVVQIIEFLLVYAVFCWILDLKDPLVPQKRLILPYKLKTVPLLRDNSILSRHWPVCGLYCKAIQDFASARIQE